MPSHSDALGYLNDLGKEVNEPWFTMICSLAGVESVWSLDLQTAKRLYALYRNNEILLPAKAVVASATIAATTSSSDFLEELSGFTNFKRLGNTLTVSLKKRITLIFGANGSGKSSLCESLKVLATPERPNRPLHNVREISTASPAFRYKFKSDTLAQTWTETVGYGPRQTTVKYFDTGIAVKNVKSPVLPGRIIELTPFKLHVFEWAMALTMQFRQTLVQAQQENLTELISELASIRREFAKFRGRPLSMIEQTTVDMLPEAIKFGEHFVEDNILEEKLTTLNELEKASSDERLKLLKAEHRDLDAFLDSLGTLLDSASNLWALEPVSKAATLAAKQSEQETLAKILIPEGATLNSLLTLLRAASPMCNFDAAADHVCPLCKRELDSKSVELFRLYYDLLADELEKEITTLQADIEKTSKLAAAVSKVNRRDWDKSTLQPEIVKTAKTSSDLIVASCDAAQEPTEEAKAALESLRAFSLDWARQLKLKADAIEIAERGSEEVAKELATLRSQIESMEYAQCIRDRLTNLNELERMRSDATFWDRQLPTFTPLQKKITEKSKMAHEELIVADFERRLNGEYITLAEKDMSAFGVTLSRKGDDAVVTVLPQISGKEIEGVLSEGEQRVHALALFFAELETCPQSVLVFDDPISSFDYNYVENCSIRLRDFAIKHPSCQLIVLTHDWYFFVQLQKTLNTYSLKGELSVQVLENCAVVADYSENTEELKKSIGAILALPGEPDKGQKHELAGMMRRLIEAVVNTHVFHGERQQYKPKSQQVSKFHKFMKLVPLLQIEATTLQDLYAKLSPTEHDDLRNAYVNTDKAAFQTRYDSILAIEQAVRSRRR